MSGCEWVVEAHGCDPAALANLSRLRAVFAELIADLDLHPVGRTTWHQFPAPGGITGLTLLSESHLACHTFPEHGSLCLNLFCCRRRADWDFAGRLRHHLGAASVTVRRLDRPYGAASAAHA
jgi:S-adenosylmethionine decarboxylase